MDASTACNRKHDGHGSLAIFDCLQPIAERRPPVGIPSPRCLGRHIVLSGLHVILDSAAGQEHRDRM